MGEIPLPTARKDMIIKIIFTRPLTTATNVIVRTLPKVIRNPRFAGGVAKSARKSDGDRPVTQEPHSATYGIVDGVRS